MGRVFLMMSCTFLLAGQAMAVPPLLTYNGRASDGGQLINGKKGVTLEIFDAETTGKKLWSEYHPSVEFEQGLFSFKL